MVECMRRGEAEFLNLAAKKTLEKCALTVALLAASAVVSAQETVVNFQSAKLAYWPQLISQGKAFNTNASKVQVTGHLFMPNASDKKVSAVVILHGIGGLYTKEQRKRVYWDYAKMLSENGVAALLVDTHGARGLGVENQVSQTDVSIYTFVADAFAAAALLRSMPQVDSSRIGVLGFSKGGGATLLATDSRLVRALSRDDAPFQLHIAVYPGCQVFPQNVKPTGGAVRFLLGAKDNYTGISGCGEIADKLKAAGANSETIVYSSAYHGWDEAVQAYKVDDLSSANCRWYLQDNGDVTADKQVLTTSQQNTAYLKQCLTRDAIWAGRVEDAAQATKRDLLRIVKQDFK